jgi:hypothetical protein
MPAVRVTAYQSTCLFGWWKQPILTLSWHDIKTNNFTWRQLRTLELTADDLKLIQPIVKEWIQRGGIQITDILDMTIFPVNPLTDFGSDLSELWALKCESVQLSRMGITYDQLLDKGITPQIMKAFSLPLSVWVDLGFSEEHAAFFTEDESSLVFNIRKKELLGIIATFSPPKRPTPEPRHSS